MKVIRTTSLYSALFAFCLVGCGLFAPATYETTDYQAIHEATLQGDTNRIVELLGVNPKLVDVGDWSKNAPLHLAALRNNPHVITIFLAKGANVNVQNTAGMTPLHLAAKSGYTNALNALLKAKPKLNVKDGRGFTPLTWAEKTNHDDVTGLLKEAGAKE